MYLWSRISFVFDDSFHQESGLNIREPQFLWTTISREKIGMENPSGSVYFYAKHREVTQGQSRGMVCARR